MNRRLAAVLLLLALLGAGAWVAWGERPGSGAAGRVGAPNEGPEAPPEAVAPGAAELAASGRKTGRTPEVGASMPVEGSSDPVGRAEGSAGRGRGHSLRGRVVWIGDEAPVAGARVTVAQVDPIAVALRVETRDRADALAVRTDAQGRFEFADLKWGQGYTLAARGPSGPITRVKVSEPWTGSDARAEIVLRLAKSGVAIRGFVHDAAGAPIAGARVVVGPEVSLPQNVVLADPDRLPEKDAETRTDEKGRFLLEDLPDALESLVVTGPLGAREVVSPVLNRTEVDVLLAPSVGIGGRVVLANGAPARGLPVVAKSVSRDALFDAVTEADGSFRIVGPSRGPHLLVVLHPTLGGKLAGAFPAGTENVLVTLPDGGALETRIVWKRDGSPVKDFRWILETIHEDGEPSGAGWVEDAVRAAVGPTRARTKDGVLRVEPLRGGKYLLRVYVDGHDVVDSEILDVPDHGDLRVDPIEIPEALRIAGVVRRADGSPVEGARMLWLLRREGEPGACDEDLQQTFMDDDQFVLSGADGTFVCEPVAPGDYRVVAVPAIGQPASVDGVRVGATDVRGLDLVVPESATLRVRVLTSEGAPAPSTAFVLARKGGPLLGWSSDAAGAPVVVEQLHAGTYALAWWSKGVDQRLSGIEDRQAPGAGYAAVAALPTVQSVTLVEGQDLGVEIALPRLVRVRAHLRPPAGATVSGRQARLGTRVAMVDDHETAEFDLLEPGPATLFLGIEDGKAVRPLEGPLTVPDLPFVEVDVVLSERPR